MSGPQAASLDWLREETCGMSRSSQMYDRGAYNFKISLYEYRFGRSLFFFIILFSHGGYCQ